MWLMYRLTKFCILSVGPDRFRLVRQFTSSTQWDGDNYEDRRNWALMENKEESY